jgi:lipoprotein-anchoring transpeptidase ErfK/SrfK
MPEANTPTGTFYVTDFVKTDNDRGVYGPYAFGVSAHSDRYSEFDGGDGQIGIHGTNEPASIGKDASHGCIRVPNNVISKLADLIPLGTPVTIT